jgi:hypothetical protein
VAETEKLFWVNQMLGGGDLTRQGTFFEAVSLLCFYYLYPFRRTSLEYIKKCSKIGHGALELSLMAKIKEKCDNSWIKGKQGSDEEVLCVGKTQSSCKYKSLCGWGREILGDLMKVLRWTRSLKI